MAKPIIVNKHPWRIVESDFDDAEPITYLTGWYQSGDKEYITLWKLNWWERIKLLFTGTIVSHNINQLPLQKISVDYNHVKSMETAWNGDLEAIAKLILARGEPP